MALIKCPECKNEISNTVVRCPQCGLKIKSNIKWLIPVIAISASLLIIIGTILLLQKPVHEKVLDNFVDVCFNGEVSYEKVEALAPAEFWYEREKQLYLYSPEKVMESIEYNRNEIIDKYGNIEFKYKINNSNESSKTKIKEIEKRLSGIYGDINIEIEKAYYIDFEVYSDKNNLKHNYKAHLVFINDNWYLCQTEKVLLDTEGITDFSVICYHNDYIEAILN